MTLQSPDGDEHRDQREAFETKFAVQRHDRFQSLRVRFRCSRARRAARMKPLELT